MKAHRSLVVDSCSMINLMASGRAREVLAALELRLVGAPTLTAEAMWLSSEPDKQGRRARSRIDLVPLQNAALLTIEALPQVGAGHFVALCQQLSDPDATVVALAVSTGRPLLTDDAKIRRVTAEFFPDLALPSTLGLLRQAADLLGLTRAECEQLAHALRWRANFLAPRTDPDAEWYRTLLGS